MMKNFDNSNISFFFSESDENANYTYESANFLAIDGRSKQEIRELRVKDIRSQNIPQYIFDEMYDWTRNKGFWTGVLENVNKNNESYWVYATIIKINDKGEVKYGMVSSPASAEQIRTTQKNWEQLKHISYHPHIGRKSLLYVLTDEYSSNHSMQ